jgi:hypothetical protein
MEYACEHIGVPYTNGFSGGVMRTIDWHASEQSMLISTRTVFSNRVKYLTGVRKHIRLYKVHGSVNYFTFGTKVIENNEWMLDPPGVNSCFCRKHTASSSAANKNAAGGPVFYAIPEQ